MFSLAVFQGLSVKERQKEIGMTSNSQVYKFQPLPLPFPLSYLLTLMLLCEALWVNHLLSFISLN